MEQLSDIDAQYLDRVYRRFKGIPWDIAETQRLRIREIAVEDVEQLYVLYEDESVVRYMDGLLPDPSRRWRTQRNTYGMYTDFMDLACGFSRKRKAAE